MKLIFSEHAWQDYLYWHKIDKKKFKEFLTTYYEAMGWNPKTGYPTRGKLAQLDLLWVEDVV